MEALRAIVNARRDVRRDLRIGALAFGVLLALGAALVFGGPAVASLFPAGATLANAHVVDGDTLDNRATGERLLVANADTPQVGAKCVAENKLALRARSAARRLVYGARKVLVRRVSGGDPSGRTFALVTVDGRDLGEALIQSGYARPRREAPAPWCDSRGRLSSLR
jgi:micrococcal nuclease